MIQTKHKKQIVFALALAGILTASLCVGEYVQASAAENNSYLNYYFSEYDSKEELAAAAAALHDEIADEGVTLLKNEDNALPIPVGSSISLFGKNSSRYSYSSTLSNYGYRVNPNLVRFYKDAAQSGEGRGTQPGNGNVSAGYNTGETPVEMYTEELKSSFADYNDAAVVVLYRVASEGWDEPRTMMWDGEQYQNWNANSTQLVPGARYEDDHYLQLDQNEVDLLQMCGENFDKVVIIFATPATFETGFLDDPGHYGYHENIKAALFVAVPRNLTSIPRILSGEVNPSGHTADTWARDFKLDPTWQNFGSYLMDGSTEVKGNQYANLPALDGGNANNYVTYNEGIYTGYRYWETRGYTEGTSPYTSASVSDKATYLDAQSGGSAGNRIDYIHGTTTEVWDNWYQAHVVYPFGYGLSYTTFTQELLSSVPESGAALTADGTITVKVKVTNTGKVAGKEVVQLYYTAPYKANEIEKAHVVLAAFGKTNLLAPNKSQTLTLTFKVRDMASYDWSDANSNAFKGYELDAGGYTVRLMKNAHEEIANVSYNIESNIQYETDDATGGEIANRFDDVSNYIPNDLKQNYLSRNNWEGTWPVFNYKLTASQSVLDGLNEWKLVNGTEQRDPNADKDEPYYTEQFPTMGVPHGIKLADLHGLDYNDALWETYLDQFTQEQYNELVSCGYYVSGKDYSELGVKEVGNFDGPRGLSPRGDVQDPHYTFSNAIIIASTWNPELAYRMGKLVGEDALWSDHDNIGGWYAPAVNIHRSQFGGRNSEYFSEDGLLTGVMAANTVKGSQEKGLPVYVKHFALNEQETNRSGVMTWANEQSMRELYFKPFELCVKDGKALGIMSAFNRIGTMWAGGSYALLTEVLRNEWGFEGCVVTDSFQNTWWSIPQMIRAGGNLALGTRTKAYWNQGTATTVTLLRERAHGLLYAQAHSLAINNLPQGEHTPVESFLPVELMIGTVGLPYSVNIATATIDKVIFPDADDSEIVYTIAEESTLPDGLTLSESGIISGYPEKEVNNFQFTVNATYAGYTKSAVFTISIVDSDGAIVYESETNLGTVLVGEAMDHSVAGAFIYKPNADPNEVLPAIKYSLKSGSLLPNGLTLSSDGKITGTPTAVCMKYPFTVVASAKGYRAVELTFTISVYNRTTFVGGTLANGKVGVSYVQHVALAESQRQVTYELSAASRLPNGLVLTSGGYITGTPRETVTDFTFIVVAKAAYSAPVEAEYKITIGLNYNDASLTYGRAGEEYIGYVNTAQGASDIIYALKAGSSLPAGLTLSEDGVITGTPTEAGTYEFTVVARSDGKLSDELIVKLAIISATLPSVGTDNSNKTAVIVGVSVAAAVVVLGAVTTAVVIIKKKRKKQ